MEKTASSPVEAMDKETTKQMIEAMSPEDEREAMIERMAKAAEELVDEDFDEDFDDDGDDENDDANALPCEVEMDFEGNIIWKSDKRGGD